MSAARTLASKIFAIDTSAGGAGEGGVGASSSTGAAGIGAGNGAQATFPQETIWNSRSNYAWDIQLLFKRRITNLYLTATSLRSYVELNYSGFRKILKK